MRQQLLRQRPAELLVLNPVAGWASRLWATANVLASEGRPRRSPQARPRLLFTMSRLKSDFFAPAFDSLAEALVEADDRRAIAALSPSALSLESARKTDDPL